MKMATLITVLWSLCVFSSYAASNTHNEAQRQPSKPLDSRIEHYVQKVCGDDTACIEKKRTEYIERMAQYQQHVKDMCGEDIDCKQAMKRKYMKRRAQRESRIAEHCGDDEACRDQLRERYSAKMKEARETCGDKKACWKKFYDDNKPKQ